MPDGLLNEIATDGPGFLSTSRASRSAGRFHSRPWLEPERATLERELTPVD